MQRAQPTRLGSLEGYGRVALLLFPAGDGQGVHRDGPQVVPPADDVYSNEFGWWAAFSAPDYRKRLACLLPEHQ